jgi:1-acyl-sn-glycerol-3-phosphate acyltransferase
MHQLFYGIYKKFQQHKWLSLFAVGLLFFGFLFFALKINFEEDISRVLPQNDETDITTKVLKQLDFSDQIAVIIQKEDNGSFNDLTEMASRFLDSIVNFEEYILKVQGTFNEDDFQETLDFVYENLPLFLEAEDYEVLAAKLQGDSIRKITENNYKTLISPTGIISRDLILKDPLGLTFLAMQKLQGINTDENLEFNNGYLSTKDESKILLFLKPKLPPSETKQNAEFSEKLLHLKSKLNNDFKGNASIDYYGANLSAVANANQIKTDILTTITLSLSVLMLILMVYYRNVFIPVIVFIPTIIGAAFSLACVYFLLGTVSAISISVGAILLGITLDYSLHILTHFKHNNDVKTLYKNITKPVVMSSTTTAAAFLCLLFVESDVLKDLGIFAALSVITSAFFALLLIPHLYRPSGKKEVSKNHFFDRIAAIDYHKNKVLITVSVVAVVASLFVFGKLQFNSNLSDLNYVPDEIKAAEAKLESTTNLTSKSIYIAAYGTTAEEALKKNETVFSLLNDAVENQEISKFSSIRNLITSEEQQQQKINVWRDFWNEERTATVKNELIESGRPFGFLPTTHNRFYTYLGRDFDIKSLSDFEAESSFPIEEFISEKEGFFTVLTIAKIEDHQREDLFSKFKDVEGVLLIDRQEINETFLGQLKDDFGELINYSLIVIILLLWLFFKRLELVLISIIPIIITAIVTVGMLVLLQIELNIFSLIVCTLIFGIGVDFSIFMTSALQKKYTGFRVHISTYKASILLAVLTTTLAIGVLVFAKHPALKSISVASIVGVFSALIVTFVFYPLLFAFFFENRVKKGNSPVSLRLLVHSFFSFFYYGFGGLLIAVLGPVYLFLVPVKKETKIIWFRKVLSKYLKSVLYTNPFVTKEIINKHKETFEKPAVIISNHTSFLDSITVGMLSPKIIFLVNDWVYNSVIIGGAARMAGFYPVSKGLEGGISHLRKKVEEGYSLMIFPEATRSTDNVVRRFHKGAFFLAEEFNLDVLPVYIHGNVDVCPKGDHIIYDGKITVIVDKRIAIEDKSFGESFAQRTKSISKYFKKAFAEIRKEQEDENYYRKTILLSFLYKESDVYKTVKANFDAHKKTYHLLNNHLDENASILRLANDYGEWDALLSLQHPKRKIESYIQGLEKRSVAASSYIVNKRSIRYIESPDNSLNEWQTLLISDFNLSIEEINKLLNRAENVILLHNFTLKSHLESLSFKLVYEGEFLVFSKMEPIVSD